MGVYEAGAMNSKQNIKKEMTQMAQDHWPEDLAT